MQVAPNLLAYFFSESCNSGYLNYLSRTKSALKGIA